MFYETSADEETNRVTLTCKNIVLTTFSGPRVRCDIVKVAQQINLTQKIKTVKYSYNANLYQTKGANFFATVPPMKIRISMTLTITILFIISMNSFQEKKILYKLKMINGHM